MNQNDKTLGPAEIIKLVAREIGVQESDLRPVRSAWTQKIRRELKKAGQQDKESGNYATSLVGARILFKELRSYFYQTLGRANEIAEAEEAEEAAKQMLRDRRTHFERNAPTEWLEAIEEMKLKIADQPPSPEPEYSEETLEAFEKHHEDTMSLNAISDEEELAFMVRAIFLHTVGKDFDFARFRRDYADRRYYRGLLQYPGDGPVNEQVAARYIALDEKVSTTLEGRDLSAYLPSGSEK